MMHLPGIVKDFAHLFFPHLCAGCGTDIIGPKAVLCVQCLDNLPVTNFHLYGNNPVEKIYHGRLPVIAAASFCYFTKDSIIQSALHQLKYKGNKEVGYFMGRLMAKALGETDRFMLPDVLVPLPLFESREKKRGYNQATVLCEGMSQVLGIPVLKDVVCRVRSTETQTRKNRIERWQNMEGKFAVTNEAAIRDKHVMLVDDVITTGATLEACGLELLNTANTRVSIFTLAYTVK